jgi:hypothetical protein
MNDLPPGYYPYPPPWTYAPYALDPVSGQPLNPAMAPPVNPYAMPPAYYPPAAMPVQAAPPTGMLTNPGFLKGAVVGGLAAYLLTNDQVQQALIRNSVKVWALFQGGVEEMKERFRDAEAELHASQAAEPE